MHFNNFITFNTPHKMEIDKNFKFKNQISTFEHFDTL